MYDPLVVDAFVEAHEELESEMGETANEGFGIEDMMRSFQAPAVPASVAPIANKALGDAPERQSDEAGLLVRQLSDALPGALCAYFSIDEDADEVVAIRAYGPGAESLLGIRHPVGHSLTGWVAANRRPIWNSDAALDLARTVLGRAGNLSQCSSVPISNGDQLLGVVTLYSPATSAFAAEHQRLLEFAASRLPEKIGSEATSAQ
jgi:signal transduction protein with GAF and PtsI domain